MSLAHAVLTSLIEKSSSGYDLARRFDKSIGYFWHASHQQIYRELARMETAGWIESSVPADAGKTRKREYRVLPAGRKELKRRDRKYLECEEEDSFTETGERADLTDPRTGDDARGSRHVRVDASS